MIVPGVFDSTFKRFLSFFHFPSNLRLVCSSPPFVGYLQIRLSRKIGGTETAPMGLVRAQGVKIRLAISLIKELCEMIEYEVGSFGLFCYYFPS